MSEISDEMLMSYADGALAGPLRDRIALALKTDPELARRLVAFENTGRPLSRLYDEVLREPVPDRLIAAIRNAPVASSQLRSAGRSQSQGLIDRIGSAVKGLIPEGRGLMLAGSCLAALVLGFTGAWQLGLLPGMNDGPAEGIVAQENGRLVARGAFSLALETQPSRVISQLDAPEGAAMVSLYSFKTREGGYCREYEMKDGRGKEFAGVACRDAGGDWDIDVQTRIEKAHALVVRKNPVVASGEPNPVTNARINELIAGPALGEQEEGELLKKSWVNQSN